MKYRDFLKPTVRKVIFLVVSLVALFFIKINAGECFNYCPPSTYCAHVCNPVPLFFIPFVLAVSGKATAQYYQYLIIPLVAFWYLVTCLVYMAIEKLRRK